MGKHILVCRRSEEQRAAEERETRHRKEDLGIERMEAYIVAAVITTPVVVAVVAPPVVITVVAPPVVVAVIIPATAIAAVASSAAVVVPAAVATATVATTSIATATSIATPLTTALAAASFATALAIALGNLCADHLVANLPIDEGADCIFRIAVILKRDECKAWWIPRNPHVGELAVRIADINNLVLLHLGVQVPDVNPRLAHVGCPWSRCEAPQRPRARGARTTRPSQTLHDVTVGT